MGSIYDEFEFIMEEEEEIKTFEEDSEDCIEKAKEFIEQSKAHPNKTIQGINIANIVDCISIGETDIMPWKHVKFTLDINKLKDIANDKIIEFTIPSFIEELESIGDNNGTEFGYNQSARNKLKILNIPKSVTVIAHGTFAFYKKLERVNFEEGSKLIYLGDQSFVGCDSLHKIDISNCENLDEIQPNTFTNSAIQQLTLSKAVKYNETLKEAIENSNITIIKIGKEKIDLCQTP